ncbi:MAG: hypothetical protein RIC56_04570 [Pseudomonadales bacterium]
MKKDLREQLEKQRQAREDSRNRANKLAHRKPQSKKIAAKKSEKKKTSQPREISAEVSGYVSSARFADERHENLKFDLPHAAYRTLTHLLLKAHSEKSIELALVWPAVPQSVAAIHALATFGEYEQGNKNGLRTLIYPTKRGTFNELNHIRVDAAWLNNAASQWQTLKSNQPDSYRSRVATENEYKDFLYLALHHYLDAEGDPHGYPSIGETIPSFPAGQEYWGDFTKRIFKGVFSNVSRRGYPTEGLGVPEGAPDALFGIHPDLSAQDIVERLNSTALSADAGRAPDVAILDLRYHQRNWLGNGWLKKVERFVGLISKDANWSPIGALIVVDDPIFLEMLDRRLTASARKKSHQRPAQAVATHPLLCLDAGVVAENENTERPIVRSNITLSISDIESAALAREFYGLAKATQDESQNVSERLRSCGGYLLWAARLPCGQTTLQRSLDEESRSEEQLSWKTREYTWVGARARLIDALDTDAAVKRLAAIQAAIERGNRLIGSYDSGTPSSKAMFRFIEEVQAQVESSRKAKRSSKRPLVTVAVTSALQARLVAAELQANGFNLNTGEADFIQVIRTAEMFSENHPALARRLIVLGARARTIGELCAARDVPKRVELVVSVGDAERIQTFVEHLTKVKAYDYFRPVLESVEQQISSYMDSINTSFSVLRRAANWRPAHGISIDSTTEYGNASPPDFVLNLDGHPPVASHLSRPFFVYDSTRRPPFSQKGGNDLLTGDLVLIISDAMRDDVESLMDSAGFDACEKVVRRYHQHVAERIKEEFDGKSTSETVTEIRVRLAAAHSDVEDFTDAKIRYWVTVERELSQPLENLLSHAPRSKKDYDAFMVSIGIKDQQITDIYWSMGIARLRAERRSEGRYATMLYQRLLIDPDSVANLVGLSAATVDRLLNQARLNLFEIQSITRL